MFFSLAMQQSGSNSKRGVSRQRRTPHHRPPQKSSLQHTITFLYLAITFVAGTLVILFFSGRLIIGGVPSSVIMTFLQDNVARNAYMTGNAKTLHDRLDDMGIEEDMKDYYRPQIPDEVELDWYIHQILYDRTGYVGVAYRVGPGGKLTAKKQ
jgi:hypothetical protein